MSYVYDSRDSNHSLTSTALDFATLIRKEERKRQKQQAKANTLPSTEYCRVRMRIILIL